MEAIDIKKIKQIGIFVVLVMMILGVCACEKSEQEKEAEELFILSGTNGTNEADGKRQLFKYNLEEYGLGHWSKNIDNADAEKTR